ncbi:hypothetical protein ACFSR7_31530 [Cohnella sp. GCM10020058]|uniref:hypothetical protein n=1 Tax=Cohnella sp. GCM10020058 TaxID=3317330 RepID=UPI003628579C
MDFHHRIPPEKSSCSPFIGRGILEMKGRKRDEAGNSSASSRLTSSAWLTISAWIEALCFNLIRLMGQTRF